MLMNRTGSTKTRGKTSPRRALKWYRRVETKLKETSIYNVYIIDGDAAPHNVDGKTKRYFLSFKLDSVLQLVGN